MNIRNLPVSQGLAWFKQAIDLGARNPRAVFGAALLAIATLYAAVALALLLLLGLGRGLDGKPGLGLLAAVALPMTLAIMVLVPILLGGLMHVIREVEAGRPARARDVFVPLRQGGGRRLALLGLVQLGIGVVGGALTVALAGSDYWRDYLQAMQAAMQGVPPVMPEPNHPGLLFLLQLAFNYFSYALMLFAIPLMLFSGSSLGDALRDALRASVRNVGANLLAGVLFLGALLAAAVVLSLLATLLGLLGAALHPLLGTLPVILLMLGFASVVLVLVAGAAYLAWRDTFGDAAAPPQVHGIEV